MLSKKAAQLITYILITLILGLLVFILLIPNVSKEFFSKINLFPAYNASKENIIPPAEVSIPDEEKLFPPKGKQYPTVRLLYTGSSFLEKDDLFAFRWNPNINKPKGKLQVTISINTPSSQSNLRQDIWMTNPDLLKGFLVREGISTNEANQIIKIMESENEEGMLKKITEISQHQDHEYWKIDFPQADYNSVPAQPKPLSSFQDITNNLYCLHEPIFIIYQDKTKDYYFEASRHLSEARENPTLIQYNQQEIKGLVINGLNNNQQCIPLVLEWEIKDTAASMIGSNPLKSGSDSFKSNNQFYQRVNLLDFITEKNKEQYTGKEKIYSLRVSCKENCGYSSPVTRFKEKIFYFSIIE